jgi:Zn-dependent peptidase ImmA (M78 family)
MLLMREARPLETRIHPNDRMLLERFAARIDGFNLRQQRLEDLSLLCERRGIEFIEIPLLTLHGCALCRDGIPFLYINSRLSRPEKVIAGFHEFCHLTDHSLEMGVVNSSGNFWNLSKLERQAQLVGVLAWMPQALARGLSVEELIIRFGVKREVATFRAAARI